MMNIAWLFAGGAAITGLLATCWSYIRSFYQYVMSWLIISVTVQGYQSDALQLLLREQFRASRFGPRLYAAWLLHVRPTKRTQLVTMEVIGSGGRLFWDGWKPIWIVKSNSEDDSVTESGVTSRDYANNAMALTFVRGVFDVDQLMKAATDLYNQRIMAFDEEGQPSSQKVKRHFVRHIFGSVGKSLSPYSSSGSRQNGPSTAGDTNSCMHHRPIGWEFSELGSSVVEGMSSVDQLALSGDAHRLVDEAWFWKKNERWYRDRGIPWRRGWLLYGPPGTGKTALIRALAEDLDLPVFIYDLASMHNKELQQEWSKMLAQVPCMAVIEDIDSVFHGRTNMVSKEQQSLTFDCLLNCLDGVQRSNGLFVAITTNHLERIDPALGCPQGGISTRPGRIDRTLQLGPLGEDARIKIACRILPERVDLQEKLVFEGDGDTAAQFQERCSRIALELLWDQPKKRGFQNPRFIASDLQWPAADASAEV